MELDANADVLGAVEVEGHVLEDNEDISVSRIERGEKGIQAHLHHSSQDAAVGAMPSTSSAPMETEETAVNPAEETAMVVRADVSFSRLRLNAGLTDLTYFPKATCGYVAVRG